MKALAGAALLLNASYEPLAVIPIRRAVVLVLRERADVVEANAGVELVTAAGVRVAAPGVVRLRRYVKIPYRATVPVSRRNVLIRDHHRCGYCDRHANTVDHIVPRCRGGASTWDNLVAACLRCNNVKGDRGLDQLGWRLRRRPYAPTRTEWIVVGYTTAEQWKPYIDAYTSRRRPGAADGVPLCAVG